MDIWICAPSKLVIEGSTDPKWLKRVEESRFKGFFLDAFDVTVPIDLDEVAQAAHILKEMGYEVAGCGMPLGHPEGIDTPHFTFHEGWHIRHNIDGKEVRWCNAITPQLIKDLRERVVEMRDRTGITTIFWDDDLRQGNHEGNIQGCFCDNCLAEFAEKYPDVIPAGFNRESMRPVINRDPAGLSDEQLTLREAWLEFTCERVTRFMRETDVEGVTAGIMVMHNGDRRHGIDIQEIKKAVPNCLFRVGELMFDDKDFNPPENKRSLAKSILTQMALINDPDVTYSESTVYPHDSLTPDNLRKKLIIERRCGLEHINLMSMERMNSDEYYEMLRDNYDLLESIRQDITLENVDSFDFESIK